MIVVGARFRALAGARAALRAVRSSVDVAPGDVSVRALGSTRYELPIDDFVLAGRFEPEDVETVVRILHSNGGRVLMQRIESPARGTAAPSVTSPRAATRQLPTRGRLMAAAGARKRPRRPSPPLRVRTARSQRIEG